MTKANEKDDAVLTRINSKSINNFDILVNLTSNTENNKMFRLILNKKMNRNVCIHKCIFRGKVNIKKIKNFKTQYTLNGRKDFGIGAQKFCTNLNITKSSLITNTQICRMQPETNFKIY